MKSISKYYKKILFIAFFAAALSVAALASYTYAEDYSWTQSPYTQYDWKSVAMSPGGRYFAITSSYSNYIYLSYDRGQSWSPMPFTTSPVLATGLAISDDGHYVIVGTTDSGVFVSGDYGSSFTRSLYSYGITAVAVPDSGTKMYAALEGGYVYQSNDSGINWTGLLNPNSVAGGAARTWASLACSSDCYFLYGASGTYVYRAHSSSTSPDSDYYFPDGPTGTFITNAGEVKSVATSADGSKVFAAVYGDYIYRSTDYGITYSPVGSTNYWTSVSVSDDGFVIVASTDTGSIVTSKDGGDTWSVDPSFYGNIRSVSVSSDGTRTVLASSNAYIQTGVDVTPPTVKSISSITPDGSYRAGMTLQFTVKFSEPVHFTSPVVLNLYAGSGQAMTTGTCDNPGGSMLTTTCSYVAQSGENLSDPIQAYISNSGITDNSSTGLNSGYPVLNNIQQHISIDNSAPAAPGTPAILPDDDTGIANSDQLTRINLPRYSISCEGFAGDEHALISLYSGNTLWGTSTCSNSFVAIQASNGGDGISALTNGTYTDIHATATDLAGNVSAASNPAPDLTIDATPYGGSDPSRPTLIPADDSGVVGDNLTNVIAGPRFTGSCEPGSYVMLLLNGQYYGDYTYCGNAGDGAYTVGMNFGGSGSPMSNDSFAFTVAYSDIYGNLSNSSPSAVVTFDAQAPFASTPHITVASDTGISASDNITSSTTPIFTGFCSDSSESLQLRKNGFAISAAIFCVANYNLRVTTPLSEGLNNVYLQQTDGAGNVGTSSIVAITVDSIAPTPVSSSITDSHVVLQYSGENLAKTSVPSLSAFAVTVNGIARSVSSLVIATTSVSFNISSPVSQGDVASISYTSSLAGPSKLKDVAGNLATDIVNLSPTVTVSSNSGNGSGGLATTQVTGAGGVTYSTGNQYTAPVYVPPTMNIATSTQIVSLATSTASVPDIAKIINATTPVFVANSNLSSRAGEAGGLLPQRQVFVAVDGTIFQFTRNLSIGQVNTFSKAPTSDIKKLQIFLNGAGYPVALKGPGSAGLETNAFGPGLRSALLKFQKAVGIKGANGMFGPATRAYVNSVLKALKSAI